MRTTLTIDDHLMDALKEKAQRDGKTLRHVVNEAIRAGLQTNRSVADRKPYVCKTFSMGHPPNVNFDKVLALGAALEDQKFM